MKYSYKILAGNTYPIKELIKQHGGEWDDKLKCWKVPKDKYKFLKEARDEHRGEDKARFVPSVVMKW